MRHESIKKKTVTNFVCINVLKINYRYTTEYSEQTKFWNISAQRSICVTLDIRWFTYSNINLLAGYSESLY